jgi:hypothetical protein
MDTMPPETMTKRILPLMLALIAAPIMALAQTDTLVVPAPSAPAVPPAPGTPQKSVVIERTGGAKRIVVVEGDTTIVITEDGSGRATVVMTTKDGEVVTDSVVTNARRAYVAVGADKGGGYVRVGAEEDGDSARSKEPVVIEFKRRTLRIYSDTKEVPSDSVRFAERSKEYRTERRNLFTYWAGIDLGVNTLLGGTGSTDLQGPEAFMTINNGRSRFFALNFMEQKIEFGSHHAGLLTGLGWEIANYHLENNVLLAYNRDSVYGITVDSPELRKNKLRQMGIRVPLMLEFNTKRAPLPTREDLAAGKKRSLDRKGNFHIAMGVVGSWYFNTMYKQKYTAAGDQQKDRSSGDYQLLPYRAAASVRVGYGGLNLFAEYGLTPLFRDGKGPELTPLNVGLTLVGFN